MDGINRSISVALPTWNHLNYLKKCLYSIKKYSVLPKTEVSIFVDGSTDGTFEWLEEQGIPYNGRKEHIGCFSGWNRAVEHCRNEYFIIGEDDTFYGPEWDLKLAVWIEELGEDYVIMPQLVEPCPGSYDVYDCGRNIEEFDEEKFVAYCKKYSERHEVIGSHQGFWTMKKSLFLSVGGFDEFYDPGSRGTLDLQVRLHRTYPNLRWVRVLDCMLYHFPPKLHRPEYYTEERIKLHERNVKYFENKYGINAQQAFKTIPVGRR